jgi:diguanylate cyclase (GGDEF)-like protein/PAS domain S-box-containing protein
VTASPASLRRLLARLRRSTLLRVYEAADVESAGIRAAHLNAVTRFTPHTMAIILGNGALVIWAFWSSVPPGMWAWLALLYGVSGTGAANWWRERRRVRTLASPKAIHRATIHASLLALVWAVLPLVWFPQASPEQRLLLATLVTGMLSAGAFVLSPLPLASLAYVVIFTLAGMGALWQTGVHLFIGVAVLLLLYAMLVAGGALVACRKATELLLARAQAQRQERMLAVLLQDFEQGAADALWETDAAGALTHHSPRLPALLGVARNELRGSPFLDALVAQGADVGALRDALASGRPFRDVRVSVRSATTSRHWAVQGKRLVDDDGERTGWRGVLADVTEQVSANERLRQLAHTDSLTGLGNRFTMHEALRAALAEGRLAALLALDLDNFKLVNDSLGHAAGDQLLQAVAGRLLACKRQGDVIARLGGDEFAVLIMDVGVQVDTTLLARRFIDAIEAPVTVAEREMRIGVSIGVAHCTEVGVLADELLVQADVALYAAKEAGRGRMAVYSAALGDRNRRRVQIEQALRVAVARGELELHWQPKIDIRDRRLCGVEALLRWQHPELGRIAPDEFIPIAEKSGAIHDIGAWVLEEACRIASQALPGLVVAFNVSPEQLRGGAFAQTLRDALLAHRLEPERLELEITESLFIEDVDAALKGLLDLRRLGVRVALDDFGSGYSSLGYIRQFPFDSLKIDRAFVCELLSSEDARAIVRLITQLALTLRMRTVAEGVETAEQLAAVTQAGCDEVQGYYMSRPLPLPEFLAFRAAWVPQAPPA